MKKILKRVYRKYISIKKNLFWNREFKNLSKKVEVDNNIKELILKGKCMILIPHSDDEWIGCSQVIQKNKNEKLIFCNMNMQGGDSDTLHKIRYDELNNTAERYNALLYTITDNKIENLKIIIQKENPETIFVPFFLDWHFEHIETIKILYNVLNTLNCECNIVAYQVSLPILPKMMNAYIPLNKKEFDFKWKYFEKIYKTQTKIPYKRFMYNERINGKLVNHYSCESYVIFNIDEWKKLYTKINLSESEINNLMSDLNSIIKTRKNLEDIYLKLSIKKC